MYKVAICDDEKITCEALTEMLINATFAESSQHKSELFEIDTFYDGESLLEQLKSGVRYDFLFLDIHLTAMNGVDVGKWIREELKDYKTLIIYISSDISYAMSLFQVQPFDFLVKPLKQEQVEKVIGKGIWRLKDSVRFLEYQKNRTVCKVNCEDILYLFSDRKTITLIKTDGQKEEFYGKIKEVYTRFPNHFIRINQSYIINNNYVQRYGYEEVTMVNNQTFLISRSHRKEVRELLQKIR